MKRLPRARQLLAPHVVHLSLDERRQIGQTLSHKYRSGYLEEGGVFTWNALSVVVPPRRVTGYDNRKLPKTSQREPQSTYSHIAFAPRVEAYLPDCWLNTGPTRDLYRYYDAQGYLLYVGQSFSAFARASQHRQSAGWWRQVHKMTREEVPAAEINRLEMLVIRTERPRYNVVGNKI